MKKILGSLLFFPLVLLASYSWEMKLAKTQVFKDEPFLIEFTCQFEGRDPDYYIEFKPAVSGMTFERLDYKDDVIDEKRRVYYAYIVRASKLGSQKISLDLLMRKTTEESIKETIIGRDNNQDLVFDDTKVRIKTQTLVVKDHGLESALVGDFTVQETISSQSVDAFAPVQLVRKIKGHGNFKEIPAMTLDIKGVKIFANTVVEKLKLTPKGYEGEMIWRFAIIGDRNFTIPAFSLDYFSVKTQKEVLLQNPAYDIAVKSTLTKEGLLDDEIYPVETVVIEWEKHLKNLLLFLLGMVTLYLGQKMLRLYKKERPKAWYESINSVEGLLLQLISKDSKKYQSLIETIEGNMQEKKLQSLKHYKMLLKSLEG